MSAKVLLVEDDTTIARVYREYLSSALYDVTAVENGADAMDALNAGAVEIALIDLRLPDMNGLDILRLVDEQQIPVEIVVITGNGSMSNAIDAMKLGASDFLVKPFNKERLLTTVENALKRQSLDRVVKTYREKIDRQQYQGFVGSSLAMQGVYRIIESAAQSKVSAFVTGESGTGKEVCAEAIHRASSRADKPFIALNCGAIPKDLIESEIFGHIKGAFTGAVADRKGAAQMANGGTLFLDEIAEMDINLQPKLLRFLQTSQVQSVGSSKIVDVDVRIICATNRDPLQEVAAGRFREDLYYRLHVLPIQLPALRERSEDVLEIARHFLALYCAEEGKAFTGFTAEVENAFLTFPWPGNVRQLQNVIRNIVVLHDGEQVDGAMLPAPLDGNLDLHSPAIAPMPRHMQPFAPTAEPSTEGGTASIRPLAELERDAISNALAICAGNVPEAAHYLGISAATIYRKKSSWKNGAAA